MDKLVMLNGKTALFGIVIAVAAGIFGANIVQMQDDSQKALSNSLVSGVPILGHLTVVKTDSKGHITAYRQTDNLIINQGLNCMAVALFRTQATVDPVGSTGSDNCGGDLAGTNTGTAAFNAASGFRFIQIGSDSATAPAATQNALLGALTTGTGTATTDQAGVVVLTPFGSGTSDPTSTGPTVSISATGFTVGSAANTIGEAGLFDNAFTNSGTAWPNMFARQTFAAITMGTGDTLAVTWTITLAP